MTSSFQPSSCFKQPVKAASAKYLLVLILAVAFVVRLWGVDFSLPYVGPYWDEPAIVDPALRILKQYQWLPESPYPSVYIYLQSLVYLIYFIIAKIAGGLASLSEVEFYNYYPWEISHPQFYFWGRVLTVILSTATVYLAYRIGRTLFSERAGCISALLLTFSLGHIEQSRFIAVHAPAAFFITLAFFALVLTDDRPGKKWYALSGFAIGIATATAYYSLLLVIPLLLLHLWRSKDWRLIDSRLVLALCFVLVGFVAGHPVALDFKSFLAQLLNTLKIYAFESKDRTEGISVWADYARYFYAERFGSLMTIGIVIGSLWGLARYRKLSLLLLSFPVSLYVLMSMQSTVAYRNLTPLFPFFALILAAFIVDFVEMLSTKLRLCRPVEVALLIGICSVLLLSPIRLFFGDPYLNYVKVDSRTRAVDFVQKNAAQGSRIAVIQELRFHPTEIERLKKSFQVLVLPVLDKSAQDYIVEDFDYVLAPVFHFNPEQEDEALPGYFDSLRLIESFGVSPVSGSAPYFPIIFPVVRIYQVPRGTKPADSGQAARVAKSAASSDRFEFGDIKVEPNQNYTLSFDWRSESGAKIEYEICAYGKAKDKKTWLVKSASIVSEGPPGERSAQLNEAIQHVEETFNTQGFSSVNLEIRLLSGLSANPAAQARSANLGPSRFVIESLAIRKERKTQSHSWVGDFALKEDGNELVKWTKGAKEIELSIQRAADAAPMVKVVSNKTTYGYQLISEPISVLRQTDYVLSFTAKFEKGDAAVGALDGSASTWLKYAGVMDGHNQMIFNSGQNEKVYIVFSNNNPTPDVSIFNIGDVKLSIYQPNEIALEKPLITNSVGPNRIGNGGFEFRQFGWVETPAAGVESEGAHSGQYFLRVTGRGASVRSCQYITVVPDRHYTLSGYMRTVAGKDGFIEVTFFKDYDTAAQSVVISPVGERRDWFQVEKVFRAPKECKFILITCGIGISAPEESVIDFDGLSLNEVGFR